MICLPMKRLQAARDTQSDIPEASALGVDTLQPHSAARSSPTMDLEYSFKLSHAEASTEVSLARWEPTSSLSNLSAPQTNGDPETRGTTQEAGDWRPNIHDSPQVGHAQRLRSNEGLRVVNLSHRESTCRSSGSKWKSFTFRPQS